MATATQSSLANGFNGHVEYPKLERFADIPQVVDIPVYGGDGDEAVNLALTDLPDDIDELCDLLQNENAARTYWVTIALAYAKLGKVGKAIEVLHNAFKALSRGKSEDKLNILTALCWMQLWKCRQAPRIAPSQPTDDDRTKEIWLHAATSTLNDASRISPSHPPLFLARGSLYLLRASLQSGDLSEKAEAVKQALKCFDDAHRFSNGRSILAVMGKAKAHFSLGSWAQALSLYQTALERAPDMIDPDPRIGIGCCLWQLGHKENARAAWQRSLDLNPNSKIANVLVGLYYLDESNQHSQNDENFASIYKKAMTDHTQTAFKIDAMHALTCATFGHYFLRRKVWTNVERLARRAIDRTDVNAIASDGWYLLARKEHAEGDLAKAASSYSKADQARGGDEKGFVPAKFGVAQMKTLMQDFDGAKFRLDKLVEKNKNVEAMTLLGILNAEDVYSSQATGSKEDKTKEARRAIALLEQVRLAWKDPKKKLQPQNSVLINLARLYETEQPDKALACLQQVEQLELEDTNLDELDLDLGDDGAVRRAKRETLHPQLLNNIGCFHFHAEKYSEAREDFQTALSACVKLGARADQASDVDTDALVSTISFNLARTYEAEGIEDEAKKVYQGLLERHPDYVDANIRLAYLALRSDPSSGAEMVKQLMEADPNNLEVRSLYGWHINRHKKRTLALNEDQEQRHYKHTLQSQDKHDLYALTGMGNLHLAIAREMPRDTDQHKEKRSKTYMRAVEFFDKVLTLDAKNAFAAQGMAIAIMEEKRDTNAAIQIFTKVRESIKDASVHINLGHVFAEVKQYSRAIENYELALARSKDKEPHIYACLGRVWLMRGRQERKLDAYKTSLDISKQALGAAPENVAFRFNVAFVQIQLAQIVIQLPEAQKTLADVEAASQGLDEAIEVFGEIAKGPHPPFPRGDIEQRANMGKNTMKRQLAGVIEKQAQYERKNASRLEEARRKREAEIIRREEEKRLAAERAEEDRRKIREERERMAEEDRKLIERRMEDEKVREAAEWTTDEETGERKKREKKPKKERSKRKKKGGDDEDDGILAEGTPPAGEGSDGEPRRKKKRKLERKGRATSSKYKSADIVQESDEDDDLPGATQNANGNADSDTAPDTPGALDSEAPAEEDAEEQGVSRANRQRKARVLDDDEDEDEDMGDVNAGVPEAGDSDNGGP